MLKVAVCCFMSVAKYQLPDSRGAHKPREVIHSTHSNQLLKCLFFSLFLTFDISPIVLQAVHFERIECSRNGLLHFASWGFPITPHGESDNP